MAAENGILDLWLPKRRGPSKISRSHLSSLQSHLQPGLPKPGDIVYIPPNLIHHGVSLDPDCMTLSLGFRAPDAGALLEGTLETLDTRQQTIRFDDPGRQHKGAPAEILASDLEQARETIIRYLEEPHILEYVLATRVTTPYLDVDPVEEIEDAGISPLIASMTQWELDPAAGWLLPIGPFTSMENGSVIKRPLKCFNWPIRALFNRLISESSKGSGMTPSSTLSEPSRSYRPRTTVS